MREYLQQCIEEGALQGPALGIAKQVLTRGLKSLSEKQQAVFDRYIAPPCTRCGETLSRGWLQMNGAGLCDYCDHVLFDDD